MIAKTITLGAALALVAATASAQDGQPRRLGCYQRVLVLTCHGIFPPFGIRVRPNEGTDNEANEIQRRTDHRYPDRA